MGTLTTSTVSSLPTVLPHDLDRQLSVAFSAVVEDFGVLLIHPDRKPTGELAQRLYDRSQKLAGWMMRGDEWSMIPDITAVFSTMAVRSGSTDDFKAIIRIYVSDLADLPPWAVSAACRDFRQGKAGDGKWAPTQAEIRTRAEWHLAKIVAEKSKIDKVLTARPSMEHQDRKGDIKALVNDTLKELSRAQSKGIKVHRGGMSPGEIARAQVVASMIENGTPDPEPLPPLSPAALASFAIPEIDVEKNHG